jgi:branched-chain amino acid transport system ATP-binding protein
MSGGQQQMLAIGQALMCWLRYLVIDEMSLGLAPLIVKRLVAAIVNWSRAVRVSYWWSCSPRSLADDAVVMRRGEVRYNGPTLTLRSEPEALDRAYFQPRPLLTQGLHHHLEGGQVLVPAGIVDVITGKPG